MMMKCLILENKLLKLFIKRVMCALVFMVARLRLRYIGK